MTKRILVVDDDDGIRDIIQFALEALSGWQVIPAVSGQEAIEKAISEQPDAILLDLMMPDMDGLVVLDRLKANPITQAIPTIVLTAKAQSFTPSSKESPERQKLISLGIAGVIIKPFKAQTLVTQIQTLLHWSDE